MGLWGHGDKQCGDTGIWGRRDSWTRGCGATGPRSTGTWVTPVTPYPLREAAVAPCRLCPVPEQHGRGTARPGLGPFPPGKQQPAASAPCHRGSPGVAALPTAPPRGARPCPDPLGTGVFLDRHGTARNRSPPPAGAPAAWHSSLNVPRRAASPPPVKGCALKTQPGHHHWGNRGTGTAPSGCSRPCTGGSGARSCPGEGEMRLGQTGLGTCCCGMGAGARPGLIGWGQGGGGGGGAGSEGWRCGEVAHPRRGTGGGGFRGGRNGVTPAQSPPHNLPYPRGPARHPPQGVQGTHEDNPSRTVCVWGGAW